MPEGDTVYVAAGRLHGALAGQRLQRTDFRVPRFATSDLSGQLVREVVPRGKHLLFRTDGEITLHTHFRMDGRWDLYRPGARLRWPAHEIRVVLETEPWAAVGTRLGIVELLRTADEEEVLGHLGPDVLGPDWDPREAVRRLRLRPDRPVGEALIDQSVMAGPGNVYKSEVLFLRGVNPWIPVGDVADVEALVALTHRAMDANRTTGAQVTTGDTRRGRGRWVYGRAGDACRRCGTRIRRADQGGAADERVTYWCPHCQPAPGGE
jgi:endonuclease-8